MRIIHSLSIPTGFTIRTYLRFPSDGILYYLGPDFLGKGRVRDVSRNGWHVEGDVPVSVGLVLPVAVRVADQPETILADQPETILVEKAVVRWTKGAEFGLEVCTIRSEHRIRLTQLLTSLLQQAACPKF